MVKERVPLRPEAGEEDDEPFVVSEDELREDMDKSHMPGGEDGSTTRRQGGGEHSIEERAVHKLVEKLREKGKSEEFIEEHMEVIREKARKELHGQERR